MTPKQHTYIFPLLLVFYEITTYLSNDMYLPALPQIAADLHTPHAQAQFSLTTWFLGATSMQLILGPLSDRYGRRPILLLGGIIFILSTIVCALAPDISILLSARFVEGAVICSVITAGYASIHELYDQSTAIRMLALMGSVVVLAPAFGPLFGSSVLIFANWRWIFWIIAILSSIAIGLLFKFMPETNSSTTRHPIILSTLMKHYGKILTNPNFLALGFTFFIMVCNFIVWLSAAPFIVFNEFGLNTIAFSIAQVFIFIFLITANRLIKSLMEKLGLYKLIAVGICIAFCGALIGVISAIVLPNFFLSVVISMSIYAFGTGLITAPLNRLAVESCSQPMGMCVAVFSTFTSAFCVAGSLFASTFYRGTLISFACIIFCLTTLGCIIFFSRLLFLLRASR